MRLGILIICATISGSISALELGVGAASSYDGRFVPSLNVFVEAHSDISVSGSSAGVATKAYYHNTYTLAGLQTLSMGNLFLGQVNLGFGLGMYYAKKAVNLDPLADGQDVVDHDTGFGPAFRLAIIPTEPVFVAFEYVMGLGIGAFGLGFGDTGSFSLGVRL